MTQQAAINLLLQTLHENLEICDNAPDKELQVFHAGKIVALRYAISIVQQIKLEQKECVNSRC